MFIENTNYVNLFLSFQHDILESVQVFFIMGNMVMLC
jgi:hypothetical protein